MHFCHCQWLLYVKIPENWFSGDFWEKSQFWAKKIFFKRSVYSYPTSEQWHTAITSQKELKINAEITRTHLALLLKSQTQDQCTVTAELHWMNQSQCCINCMWNISESLQEQIKWVVGLYSWEMCLDWCRLQLWNRSNEQCTQKTHEPWNVEKKLTSKQLPRAAQLLMGLSSGSLLVNHIWCQMIIHMISRQKIFLVTVL